jgi:hypothetical protein
MSLVAGDVGSKTILPDGAQVDHLSENTVGHGVRVKGISDPTTYPVLTGDVGEVFGSDVVGAGGKIVVTSTTTLPPLVAAAVVSQTLNKGVYLCTMQSQAWGSTHQLGATLRIGGTSMRGATVGGVSGSTDSHVSLCLPVVITTDSTVVSIFASYAGTVPTNALHTLGIMRIA